MSKILAIADIHIHDYPNRNPNDRFRLDQSSIVADNIIAVAQREGIDTIVIAGDTLEKSMTRAYILGNARKFLWKIMSYFREGFIIWGNHDLDTKGSNQLDEDCYLSLFLPPNLHYADHRTIKIDNTSIAFSNWYPEFDLSWITEPVDVLFTHATIDYSGGNSMFRLIVLFFVFILALTQKYSYIVYHKAFSVLPGNKNHRKSNLHLHFYFSACVPFLR